MLHTFDVLWTNKKMKLTLWYWIWDEICLLKVRECLYFYVFLAKCRLYSSIFLLILKKILWDSSILCYYTILLYTNISRWWIGLFGFMVLLLVAVSRNFLILCFLYFFETSIEPRKFRLSFSFWLLLTLSKLWKKHQTKSKTYSTSTMTLSLKKIFFYHHIQAIFAVGEILNRLGSCSMNWNKLPDFLFSE